jgi:hypothetical protein
MWEQQSQWADSNLDAFFASTVKPNFFDLLTGGEKIMQLTAAD